MKDGGKISMKKLFAVTLILALIISSLTACGSNTGQGDVKTDSKLLVGLSIRSLDNSYYVSLVEGATNFLDTEVGKDNYELQIMEHQGSDEKQLSDVKAFLAKAEPGNAILHVDPNNAPNAASIAELCEEAQVYWESCWTYANGVYPMDYNYYVIHQTADNVTGAYETAKAMFESFETPGVGKVVAIQGSISNDASIEREKGWKKALAEYPGVELLDIQPANWMAAEALTLTQTWISKYGDQINGVMAANDELGMAAVEALRAEGLNGKVKVIAFDGIVEILPLIKNGDVFATYGTYPYLQGAYGLDYCYSALTGKIDLSKMKTTEERMFTTKVIPIFKDGVDDYIAKYVDSKPIFDYNDLAFPISVPMHKEDLK